MYKEKGKKISNAIKKKKESLISHRGDTIICNFMVMDSSVFMTRKL